MENRSMKSLKSRFNAYSCANVFSPLIAAKATLALQAELRSVVSVSTCPILLRGTPRPAQAENPADRVKTLCGRIPARREPC
jgi:hypothetical protein